MPTPPNRRPGVDAGIVQATTIRGFDSPQALPAAQPLTISSGLNAITNTPAEVFFWNRTDTEFPMFVLSPGSAGIATNPRFEVFAGVLPDPNGVVTASVGALYLSNNPSGLWQNTDGGTTWFNVSDQGGGEDLAETLAIGNFTGGTPIEVSPSDFITGEDATDAPGGILHLKGGNASSAFPVSGGLVRIESGDTDNGTTGDVEISTRDAGASSIGTGSIEVRTGDSVGTNPSGDVLIRSGDMGPTGGGAGRVSLRGGNTIAVGLGGSAGLVEITGGAAVDSSGTGGSLFFRAGRAGGTNPPILPVGIAGRGGNVVVQAGNSALSQPGGAVFIGSGNAGPGGAVGGEILLSPGLGSGGFPRGEVVADGVFRSENIKRGASDPNVASVPGTEGAFYQQTAGNNGAAWVNVAGTPNSWQKLGFASDFVSAFGRIQWGTIMPSMQSAITVPPGEPISSDGVYFGAVTDGTGLLGRATEPNGPVLFLQVSAGQTQVLAGSTGSPARIRRSSNFVSVTKFRHTNSGLDQRITIGFSTLDGLTALGSDTPVFPAQYIFLQKALGFANWRWVLQGPGGSLAVNTPITFASTVNQTLYAVMDLSDGKLRLSIRDASFNILAINVFDPLSLPGSVPSLATDMWPVIGIFSNLLGPFSAQLRLYSSNIVLEADKLLAGSGALITPSWSQTLLVGNTSGPTPVVISNTSSIQGELNGNGINGGNLLIVSGSTTNPAGNTGNFIAGTSPLGAGSTGSTGNVLLSSGGHLGAGNTGFFLAGSSGALNGNSGNAALASGPANSGASGVVTIGTGGAQNVGVLNLLGGNTTINNGSPGEVFISGGGFGAGINDGDGGPVTIETQGPPRIGNGGEVTITTGNGGDVSGQGGDILIQTGFAQAPPDRGGNISLIAANSPEGGAVLVRAGNSTITDGADVTIEAGDTTTGSGGSIILLPGSGPTDGEVFIQGKLTVTGLIDPTGMVFDSQVVAPMTPVGGQGLLWVNSSDELIYQNSGGTVNLSVGAGGPTSLGSLTDVSLAGVAVGQVLTFNGAFWTNQAPPVPSIEVSDLTDVALAGLVPNQVLVWNGSNWANAAVPGSSTSLGALTDVVLTAPTSGQFLIYNGADWVNSNVSIPTDLDDLGDVVLTAPVLDQVLRFDGTNWVNATIASSANLAGVLAGGNTTGANDIVLSSGQALRGLDDLAGTGGDAVVASGIGSSLTNMGDLRLQAGNPYLIPPLTFVTNLGSVLISSHSSVGFRDSSILRLPGEDATQPANPVLLKGGSGLEDAGFVGVNVGISAGSGSSRVTPGSGSAGGTVLVGGGRGGAANGVGNTGGNGGTVTISGGPGGDGDTGGNGGNVVLSPGAAGSVGGLPGEVILQGRLRLNAEVAATGSSGFRAGIVVVAVGVNPVVFGALSSEPLVFLTPLGSSNTVHVSNVTTTGFDLHASAPGQVQYMAIVTV